MLTSHTVHRMTAIMGELQPCGLSGPEQPLRLDPDAALATSDGPAAALLIGPEPRQRSAHDYEDASARFSVGV